MNVRTDWVVPRTRHERTSTTPKGRARSRASAAIEILEARGLLSVAAPVLSTSLELPETHQITATVQLSGFSHHPHRHPHRHDETAALPTVHKLVQVPSRTAIPGDGNELHRSPISPIDALAISLNKRSTLKDLSQREVAGSPTSELRSVELEATSSTSPPLRSGSGNSGAIKRSTPNNSAVRELGKPLAFESRTAEPGSSEWPGEPPPTGPTLIIGTGGSDVSEPAPAVSFFGWASDVVISVFIALANPTVHLSDLDGRVSASPAPSAAATVLPGSSAAIVGTSELCAAEASLDSRTPLELRDGASQASVTSMAASDATAATSTGAGLLDGALRADWEAVDVELRQFLARLGAFADTSNSHHSGPMWPFWVGSAAAVAAARWATHSRRRSFRRAGTGKLRRSRQHPIPIGPWPLGSS
jgi:hypothetical protein